MIVVKLINIGIWVVPVAVIAYPLTFLITDVTSELYGRRTATRVIWLGFATNVLMVILVYVGKIIPPASLWEGQNAYETMLGSVPRIVLALMLAYLVSQHHDVFAFHFWKKLTKGRFLWLRNIYHGFPSNRYRPLYYICLRWCCTYTGIIICRGTSWTLKSPSD